MAFIGNTPQTQSFAPAVDYFSGNGVTVTFTLSRPVVSVAQLTVAVDNVIQNPSSAFTVSGNSITFTSAPLSGTNNIWVEYTSLITTYAAISQDPSVIGDITATGGFLAEGDFGNSYIDGTIVDYVTGNARITTGPIDDMTFYHGGTSGRSEMMKLSYAGTNSYIVGNLGVGATTSPASQLEVKSAAFTDSVVTINSTSTNVSQRLNFTANGTLQTQLYDDSTETRLNAVTSKPMTFRTANTERMRIDSSGNVGIGTSSPSTVTGGKGLTLYGNGTFATLSVQAFEGANNDRNATLELLSSGNGGSYSQILYGDVDTTPLTPSPLVFAGYHSGTRTERMRITSGGQLSINTTVSNGQKLNVQAEASNAAASFASQGAVGTGGDIMYFYSLNRVSLVGYIGYNGSSVSYNTSSDYRLKENIAPMTEALAKVAQLKPVTYTWKSTGKDGQGFIAHELAEVVPDCVSGTKDEVDEEGNPKYQGVDTSFLVATLTAAIQELKAEVDSLKAQLEAK